MSRDGVLGGPLTPELLLKLQRQAGNRAVLKLLRALRQQTKPEPPPVVEDSPPRPEVEPKTEPAKHETKIGEAEPRKTETGESDKGEPIEDEPPPPIRRRSWWQRLWDWLVRMFWRVVRVVTFGRVTRGGD